MVEHLEAGVLPLADLAHDDVGGAVCARRYLRRGDVGDHEQRLAEVVLDRGELPVDLGDTVADGAHLRLGRRDVAAFLGDLAYLLRGGVALGLELLRLRKEGAAPFVKPLRLFERLALHAAPRKRGSRLVE